MTIINEIEEKLEEVLKIKSVISFSSHRKEFQDIFSGELISPVGVSNKKTGTVSTYRKVGDTCPSDCRFLNNGCYAQKGYVAIQQRKHKTLKSDLLSVLLAVSFASNLNIPVRLNVSGDFFLNDEVDEEFVNGVIAILKFFKNRNKEVVVWSYTHRWDDKFEEFSKFVNLRISDFDGPNGAIVVPDFDNFDKTKDHILCLEQTSGIPCIKCGLCWKAKNKTIVFSKH